MPRESSWSSSWCRKVSKEKSPGQPFLWVVLIDTSNLISISRLLFQIQNCHVSLSETSRQPTFETASSSLWATLNVMNSSTGWSWVLQEVLSRGSMINSSAYSIRGWDAGCLSRQVLNSLRCFLLPSFLYRLFSHQIVSIFMLSGVALYPRNSSLMLFLFYFSSLNSSSTNPSQLFSRHLVKSFLLLLHLAIVGFWLHLQPHRLLVPASFCLARCLSVRDASPSTSAFFHSEIALFSNFNGKRFTPFSFPHPWKRDRKTWFQHRRVLPLDHNTPNISSRRQ